MDETIIQYLSICPLMYVFPSLLSNPSCDISCSLSSPFLSSSPYPLSCLYFLIYPHLLIIIQDVTACQESRNGSLAKSMSLFCKFILVLLSLLCLFVLVILLSFFIIRLPLKRFQSGTLLLSFTPSS